VTERITISVPDEMVESIHERLSYGDNRSEWIRDAIGEKLQREQGQQTEAGDSMDRGESHGTARVVDQLDLPATVDRDDAAEAIRAAAELIHETEAATKKDIVRDIMPEHPLGYDASAAVEKIESGGRYRGAWWRKVVKPGLEQRTDIEVPDQGYSEWRPK